MAEKTYWADLHIHSALSPCADATMSPRRILDEAKDKGLSIVALTDHNTVENCLVLATHSSADFLVVPGMEIQTKEDIHILCLFGTIAEAWQWHLFVDKYLPKIPNQPLYFGEQFVYSDLDRVSAKKNNLLLVSTQLGFDDVLNQITRFNGVAIPAHIDRPSFSVLANLGFIPESIHAQREDRNTPVIVELSHNCYLNRFKHQHPELSKCLYIQNSDAHRPNEIGIGKTGFILPELSWQAVKSAFADSTRLIVENNR